jgi:hypothetical protein
MPRYSFTVAEHDPVKPWLVISSEHHRIELEPRVKFHDWARERWPEDRFTVQLDPWQDSPGQAVTKLR